MRKSQARPVVGAATVDTALQAEGDGAGALQPVRRGLELGTWVRSTDSPAGRSRRRSCAQPPAAPARGPMPPARPPEVRLQHGQVSQAEPVGGLRAVQVIRAMAPVRSSAGAGWEGWGRHPSGGSAGLAADGAAGTCVGLADLGVGGFAFALDQVPQAAAEALAQGWRPGAAGISATRPQSMSSSATQSGASGGTVASMAAWASGASSASTRPTWAGQRPSKGRLQTLRWPNGEQPGRSAVFNQGPWAV